MSDPVSLSRSLPQLIFASALSGYGLYLSYHNITRLQQYEKQSEKAAEWSNTAAQRLSKTRSTQASGTISLLASFLTSTILILAPSLRSATVLTAAGLISAGVAFLSQSHMAAFWNESKQTKIPFVEKFNEAIRGSEKVVWVLGTLSFAWASAGIAWGLMAGGVTSSGTLIWSLVTGARVVYMARMGWGM